MSKRQTLIVLGILVIILPFLGFPGNWKIVLSFATGLLISAIAYMLRPEGKTSSSSNVPFAEHRNEPQVVVQNNLVVENNSSSERPLVG